MFYINQVKKIQEYIRELWLFPCGKGSIVVSTPMLLHFFFVSSPSSLHMHFSLEILFSGLSLSLFPFVNPSLIACPTTGEYHHHISIVAAQIRRHGQQ